MTTEEEKLHEKTQNFTTSCESCIFSQWDVSDQIGCDLERLSKYIAQNKAIMKSQDNFYTINTVCNTCRGEVWANHNIGRNLIAKVEEEIRIHLAFILMSVDDDKDRIVKQLPELVKKCVSQTQIKPKQIIVVIKNFEIKYNDIITLLIENCENIPFKLVKVVEPTADKFRCLDMAIQKCYSQYYAVFDLCNNIPRNLIQTINNIANYELKPISMVKPICGLSGMIVQTQLHRIFGGNREVPIYDKIMDAAEIQKSENYIYDWGQLWNNQE